MNVLSLFDGKYLVTSSGIILSNVGRQKELVGKVTKEGYHTVVLTINGKKIYRNVHRIVAEAFIPNPTNLPQVNHIDGNKLNNSVDNLEWVNSKDNLIHARDNKLLRCKLDMAKANEIRMLYNKGNTTYTKLAERFNISKSLVGAILNNERWQI